MLIIHYEELKYMKILKTKDNLKSQHPEITTISILVTVLSCVLSSLFLSHTYTFCINEDF